MNMTSKLRCGCAAGSSLDTVALEDGLPAAVCAHCKAVLLQMDDWRRWRARGGPPACARPAQITPSDQPARARPCPACTRLMERLTVDVQGVLRVDRCSGCQYLWLDDGEWPLLVERGLASQLDALLSDGGQRRLQNERMELARWQALRQRHGDACIDEVLRIRRWLSEQALPHEILALLRAPDTSAR